MFGSLLVYSGAVAAFAGFLSLFARRYRKPGTAILLGGVLTATIGFLLPARDKRATTAKTHLDEFIPVWQFSEHHTAHIAASPEKVFEAIRKVRANEILLFRTLTWIRRGGRQLPDSILNAGNEPLLDVATRGGFIYLADDPPRELVVGTVVVAPPGTKGTLTPEVFHKKLRPGFALAAMNFAVRDDGAGGSLVSTETRVFANDDSSRDRFKKYWRVIYPGSALIRRMWLRAIEQRAEK